jgi:uncharacterized membrane protein YdjX (TVP38/TMEM64 family)
MMSIVRPGLRLALLAAVLAGVFVLVLVAVPRDADALRDALDDPVLYVLAAAALTVGFFPFPLVAAAGGLLFGIAGGTALALLGEVLGATTALLVARFAARDAAARVAGTRVRALIDGVARRGFAAVLLVRVLPGVPRHPANYAFGLTPVGIVPFVAATALGTAPRAFAYAALGGSLGDLGSPESIAAVVLLAAFAVLGLWLAARERRGLAAPASRARPAADVTTAGSGTATSSPDDRSAAPP